jgi:hypothetical protein
MSGSERINEQPKVGPKGAAPKGWRKSKYLHQWLGAGAHEKGTGTPGGVEEGCRWQARRASRFGRSANQIDEKIDEIINFAEIREFIDTPVQSYSSGMTVRLGFAVATKLASGFLVVNEVVLA